MANFELSIDTWVAMAIAAMLSPFKKALKESFLVSKSQFICTRAPVVILYQSSYRQSTPSLLAYHLAHMAYPLFLSGCSARWGWLYCFSLRRQPRAMDWKFVVVSALAHLTILLFVRKKLIDWSAYHLFWLGAGGSLFRAGATIAFSDSWFF